jgi:hypothetical protein
VIYRVEQGLTSVVPWVLLNDGPGNTTKGSFLKENCHCYIYNKKFKKNIF